MNGYPQRRLRRLRGSDAVRSIIRETRLCVEDFIYPLFVVEGPDAAGPIPSMPGVVRHRLDGLDREIERIVSRGIRSVLLKP